MKRIGKSGKQKIKAKHQALLMLAKKFGRFEDGRWVAFCQSCGKDGTLNNLDAMHKVGAGSKWRMAVSAFLRAEAEGPDNICAGCRLCHGIIDNNPEIRREMERSSANVKNGELIKWEPKTRMLLMNPWS